MNHVNRMLYFRHPKRRTGMFKSMFLPCLIVFTLFWLYIPACNHGKTAVTSRQWQEIELCFESDRDYQNPYTDVDFWVDFIHTDGEKLRRPGFWNGDKKWCVRFTSPVKDGEWRWTTRASVTEDTGLNGKTGKILCAPCNSDNNLIKHGLLRMSKSRRNVVHADGTPFLMVADTPWALPWRGTVESVTTYAQNRRERGFNAALLMSLQPDRGVDGPRDRTAQGGFDVAFEDLKQGHINRINISYFKYFDRLRDILVDHGIVPVFQPVFHGFGWKGKQVLGWTVDPAEYARYTRYLIARYGAKPAFWLVGGDGTGKNPGVQSGGLEAEKWDAYRQPTGIHYNPFDDYCPDSQRESNCFHYNKSFQDAEWLDFQWCQTGHNGEHLLHKVRRMYENKPVKAVANGEPTYEGIREHGNGSGWWQGHEAWSQFLAGGTMGVVYGAGGLWNWKLTADEPGWADWCNSNVSWREAIELSGSKYVGYLGKALHGLDVTDIEKHPGLAGDELCLAKSGRLYIVYLPEGGTVTLQQLSADLNYRWFDPKAGEFTAQGNVSSDVQNFTAASGTPAVLIVSR